MAWADTKDEGMPPNAVGNRSHDSNTRGPFVERRLTFDLSPIAPFCLEFTVWGLRRRPQNQVDRWDGTTYQDRKSTRLNSSHGYISYAVFCLKKKNNTNNSAER